MKNLALVIFVIATFLVKFQLSAQQTFYEAGRNVGKSFESDNWDFSLICTDLFYTSIIDSADAEQFYLYWFNDNKLFTAVSIKEIPDMLNNTKIDITLAFTGLLEADDSVYIYTSMDTVNWVLREKWAESNGAVNGSGSFTNTNHSYVKVELKATAGSGGSYYYFTDFQLKGDGKKPPPVGINNNKFEDFKIIVDREKINISSQDFLSYSISILNLSGQMVYNGEASGNKSIELDVPKGMYLVNILTSNGYFTKKIVLE